MSGTGKGESAGGRAAGATPATIAHYTILERLGAGGMGAVYRARDERLGRDVALKLLPAEIFADPDARARLLKEARLASALNHPNVCTIYEAGDADGQAYLAMELVRGRPLGAMIPRDGLPTQSVLDYGAQIADALEHAHAEGVVHRDLKAANVVVTGEGRAKVLDFGLAQRVPIAGADATDAATLSQSGSIAGTPPYLSPEVLRGEPADARSDIWALGILLYQMASGGMPFRGETGPALSAAILKDPAPPLPARVPAGLRSVIARCLEKDPARRYRNAGEVRAALETLRSDLEAPVASRAEGGGRWGPRVVVLLVIVAALVGSWLALRQPWRAHEVKQRQLTTNPVESPVYSGALSPDGKTLAYVDGAGLFLRSVDSGETRPVELPPECILKGQIFPVVDWFPDGSQLLVNALDRDGKSVEWVIPTLGGRPRVLLDDGIVATISRDGRHLAFLRRDPQSQLTDIWCSGPNGEDPRRLVASDSSGIITTWATWSPDGRRVAYVRGSSLSGAEQYWIETCDLSGRTRRAYTPTPQQALHPYSVPCWLPGGRLAFSLTDPPPNQGDMNLWSVRVDSKTGAPSGPPRRITQWQHQSILLPSAPSRDGKRLAVGALMYQSDCYIGRVAGGDSALQGVRRLTLDSRFDWQPSWLPDNSAIVFASDRNGSEDIFRQALDAPEAEPIVTGPGDQNVPSVSPDGAWTLYIDHPAPSGSNPAPTARLMRAPIAGGPSIKVFDVQANATYACAPPPASLCVLSELVRDQTVFTEFDPVRGRGRELLRVPSKWERPWGLSPDGKALAIVDPLDSIPRIEVVPLHGGATRVVKLDRDISIVDVSWAARGQGWLVVGRKHTAWQILRVNEKGRTLPLIPPQLWMYSAAPSPDGRWIAFTSNTGDGNIWLLEDF